MRLLFEIDKHDIQECTKLSPEEIEEDFIPVFLELKEAIKINEEYASRDNNTMIERDLRVMKMIDDSFC